MSSFRTSVTVACLVAASIFVSGCSGSPGTPGLPLAAAHAAAPGTRGPSNVPAALRPFSLSAYPISLSAYPIIEGTVPLNPTPTQACKGGDPQTSGCTIVKRSPARPIGPGTPATSLAGYLPIHLQGVYGVTQAAAQSGAGMTVAIVTTGSTAATISSDLAAYRRTLGLPACTLASGCLKIVEAGASPPVNSAWSEETAIDTEMVSAICP